MSGRIRQWAVAGMLAASVAPALAHGTLVASTPAAGAVLTAPPASLQLRFSEPVEAAFTSAKLEGPAGKTVTAGAAQVDPQDAKAVALGLPALAPGDWRVRWVSVGRDGHRIAGDIRFMVR